MSRPLAFSSLRIVSIRVLLPDKTRKTVARDTPANEAIASAPLALTAWEI